MTGTFNARRIAGTWWLVGIFVSALAAVLIFTHATEQLDNVVHDRLAQWGKSEPDPRILLVAIDNQSLDRVGPWPWPRETHARLVARLADAHPEAIAYDILFIDPQNGDELLGDAMRKAKNVYLPLLIERPGSGHALFDLTWPVTPVRNAAAGIGHVEILTDPYGVARQIRPVERKEEKQVPHLMLALQQKLKGIAPLSKSPDIQQISFSGPPGTFPAISAADVLDGRIPPEFIRGRIIIVGAMAQALGDQHATSMSSAAGYMSGVELQANILDGMLRNATVTNSDEMARLLFALLPLWAMMLGLRTLHPQSTLPMLAGISAATLLVSAVSFYSFRYWLPPSAALIGILIAYPLWAWRRLAAVSDYLVQELEELRSEPEPLSSFHKQHESIDPITREMRLLSEAVNEVRTMRNFVSECLDQLPDAVFVIDRAGLIRLSNCQARTLLAGAPILAAQSDGDEVDIHSVFSRMEPLKTGADRPNWPPRAGLAQNLEASFRDGRIFDIRMSEYRDGEATSIGAIIRMSDITAIRTIQRQRDDMVQYLTHDMRAPQTSILALTAQAKPRQMSPLLVERIDRCARRTLELADGIVHLARAETIEFDPVALNLPDLLIDAIEGLWPLLTARNMSVNIEGGTETFLVMGEANLLSRMLSNLIDNAIKYGHEGGRLDCRFFATELDGVPAVGCTIADDGRGIAPAQLENLFEHFQRGANVPTDRGAGLGLSFVKAAVIRHNGVISCQSALDAGTSFTMIFPLAEQTALGDEPDVDA